MYDQTPEQTIAEQQLERDGFHFSNWISAQDPDNKDLGCMVMTRKPNKFTTEYREIAPDGTIN